MNVLKWGIVEKVPSIFLSQAVSDKRRAYPLIKLEFKTYPPNPPAQLSDILWGVKHSSLVEHSDAIECLVNLMYEMKIPSPLPLSAVVINLNDPVQ